MIRGITAALLTRFTLEEEVEVTGLSAYFFSQTFQNGLGSVSASGES
jgi:hypothetical protein